LVPALLTSSALSCPLDPDRCFQESLGGFQPLLDWVEAAESRPVPNRRAKRHFSMTTTAIGSIGETRLAPEDTTFEEALSGRV
jgi:hypothetical protein